MSVLIGPRSLSNSDIFAGFSLSYTVNSYSFSTKGGPKEASITAFGSEVDLWQLAQVLRCPIEIYDPEIGERVWWGLVNEVEIRVGQIRVNLSLDEMANRISVIYTAADNHFETTVVNDTVSQSTYGIKERKISLSETTRTQAETYRNIELENRKYPVAEISIESVVEGSLSATIYCKGWISVLDWVYYKQPKGLVQYTDDGDGVQKVGEYLSINTISFLTASGIVDANGNLIPVNVGDIVEVIGGNNTGVWDIVGVNPDGTAIYVDVTTASFATAASGNAVQVSSGSVAQPFSHSAGSTWNARSVYLRLQKVGTPTDSVRAFITSNNSGSPGTTLASGMISSACISDSMQWTEISLTASAALATGSTYWIVVNTTCPVSGSSFYRVDVSEQGNLANPDGSFRNGGLMQIGASSEWFYRNPRADMLFKITGAQSTTEQIRDIVNTTAACITGSLLTGVDSGIDSEIYTNQYRTGENTALYEFEKLLETGNASGQRLISTVTPDRQVIISIEPSADSASNGIKITRNKDMLAYGVTLINPARCPVGAWVSLDDLIPSYIQNAPIANINRFFIEEAEYYPETKTYIPRARNAKDIWDFSTIKNR